MGLGEHGRVEVVQRPAQIPAAEYVAVLSGLFRHSRLLAPEDTLLRRYRTAVGAEGESHFRAFLDGAAAGDSAVEDAAGDASVIHHIAPENTAPELAAAGDGAADAALAHVHNAADRGRLLYVQNQPRIGAGNVAESCLSAYLQPGALCGLPQLHRAAGGIRLAAEYPPLVGRLHELDRPAVFGAAFHEEVCACADGDGSVIACPARQGEGRVRLDLHGCAAGDAPAHGRQYALDRYEGLHPARFRAVIDGERAAAAHGDGRFAGAAAIADGFAV